MPFGGLLTAGVIAGAGAYAGAQGSKSDQKQTSGINLAPASANELAAGQGMMNGFNGFQDMVNAGPGASDVTAATGASRDLASMLQSMSQAGGTMPTGQDYSNGSALAGRMFQQQRVGLQQNFMDQSVQANRQAAMQGRDMNDPILRMKLAQEQTRQGAMLDASQNQFGSQFAMQQPFQRLDLAGQRANVLGGLATQAMANRQALASMGSQIESNERNFRIQTGTRWGDQQQTSGGGLAGAITGGIAGFGAGMGIAGGMGSMFGGSSGASPAGLQGVSQSISSMGGGQFGSQGGMMGAPTGNPYSLGAGSGSVGAGGGGQTVNLGNSGGGRSQPTEAQMYFNSGNGLRFNSPSQSFITSFGQNGGANGSW